MSDIVEVMARALETIITRRIWNDRIDGYTLEASKELAAAALTALSEGGWVVVKKEATDAMIERAAMAIAAVDYAKATNLDLNDFNVKLDAELHWRDFEEHARLAMIAASDPSPIVK